MANTVRALESGKRIEVITSFAMDSNTSLDMYFKDPTGNISDAVTATLNTSTTTDENGNSVAANESAYYDTLSTTFDVAGDWQVTLKYTDTATTPDDIFYSGFVTITVLEGGENLP